MRRTRITRSLIGTLAREMMVALISIAVIVYVISYLVGQGDSSAFAIEITGSQTAAAGSVIAYGKVVDQATGKPLRGARVTMSRSLGGGSFTQVGTIVTPADGTFRIEAAGATAGTYQLVAEANVTTGTTRSAFAFAAQPGRAYNFNVNMVNKEYFVLLPLPGY